jgi:hypothetical protein
MSDTADGSVSGEVAVASLWQAASPRPAEMRQARMAFVFANLGLYARRDNDG